MKDYVAYQIKMEIKARTTVGEWEDFMKMENLVVTAPKEWVEAYQKLWEELLEVGKKEEITNS